MNVKKRKDQKRATMIASTIDVFAETPARIAFCSPRRLPILRVEYKSDRCSFPVKVRHTGLKLQLQVRKALGTSSKQIREAPIELQEPQVPILRSE